MRGRKYRHTAARNPANRTNEETESPSNDAAGDSDSSDQNGDGEQHIEVYKLRTCSSWPGQVD